jgi:hypothetical protein
LIVNEHRLAQARGELLRDDPTDRVSAATGWIGNDKADRFRGKGLGCSMSAGCQERGGGKDLTDCCSDQEAQSFHQETPRMRHDTIDGLWGRQGSKRAERIPALRMAQPAAAPDTVCSSLTLAACGCRVTATVRKQRDHPVRSTDRVVTH